MAHHAARSPGDLTSRSSARAIDTHARADANRASQKASARNRDGIPTAPPGSQSSTSAFAFEYRAGRGIDGKSPVDSRNPQLTVGPMVARISAPAARTNDVMRPKRYCA